MGLLKNDQYIYTVNEENGKGILKVNQKVSVWKRFWILAPFDIFSR